MLPLLTFASGLIAGIVGVRLVKSVTAPSGPRAAATARLGTIGDKAQTGLRQATVSGLTVIEKSSANLRAKLDACTPGAAASRDTGPAGGRGCRGFRRDRTAGRGVRVPGGEP